MNGATKPLHQQRKPRHCRGFMNAQVNATLHTYRTLQEYALPVPPLWIVCDSPQPLRKSSNSLLHDLTLAEISPLTVPH
jgi:hypothetical protein